MHETDSMSSAPQGELGYDFNKDRNKRGDTVKRVRGKGTLLHRISPCTGGDQHFNTNIIAVFNSAQSSTEGSQCEVKQATRQTYKIC